MKRVLGFIVAGLLVSAPAYSKVDDSVDESVPELVKIYLTFPCDALLDSYTFQYNELKHLSEHFRVCKIVAKQREKEYKYAHLMCMYVRLSWEQMYDHIKSVEKAYQLVCGENEQPKYYIEFNTPPHPHHSQ